MEPGATYQAVGEELYPNSAYPRQTVYNALQQPTAQAEMGKIAASIYDENELKEKLTGYIRRKKKDLLGLKSLELGMRNLAMLTDKSQVTTQEALPNLAEMLKKGQITQEDLEKTLLQHLRVSSQGIDTQQSSKDGQGKAITVKADVTVNKAENEHKTS